MASSYATRLSWFPLAATSSHRRGHSNEANMEKTDKTVIQATSDSSTSSCRTLIRSLQWLERFWFYPPVVYLDSFFSFKTQVWCHIVLHLSYVWQTPGAKSPSKEHIAGTQRFRASKWWQMSLVKCARGWKWRGCDGQHEDSFSAATCHHQCCWGVMGKDCRGLEAPTVVWGVCLGAHQGPILKCHTHLACE